MRDFLLSLQSNFILVFLCWKFC